MRLYLERSPTTAVRHMQGGIVEVRIGNQRILVARRRPANDDSDDEDAGPPCHVQ
jgi:hypothetical protein